MTEQEELWAAMIGLAKTCNNNEYSDKIYILFHQGFNLLSQCKESSLHEITEELRRQKFIISPGCSSCASPCGNTDDFNPFLSDGENGELMKGRQELMSLLLKTAARIDSSDISAQIGEYWIRALSGLAYSYKPEHLTDLIEEGELLCR